MEDFTGNAAAPMGNDSWNNSTNTSSDVIDLPKTVSLIVIFVISLFGNVCTVAIVSRFKQHKLPDVLVIGLACTDLIATFIPVPMSLYSYISLDQFVEGSFACSFYGTVAQFTRYASALIVTLIALERYFAVNKPFIYRKHATPLKCIAVLVCCWIVAFALALAPVLDSNTTISSHDGFCLFEFSSHYAISVVIYAGLQFCIVLVCFLLVTAKLLRVYRRRKELQVQGSYNKRSQAKEREHEVTFTRPKFSSRISDLGSALKKAAPIITEKFQLGVEAQFARMLFAVVALFYVSWTTIVILICVAQVKKSQDGLSLALFWGIRLSVISLALNPILYGLLARQYRMAYSYVFRWLFSKCCSRCVDPPLKDIFVTARTVGGELQGDTRQSALERRRMQQRNYGSHSNHSMNGSLWSGRPGLPVLTHTTHLSLDLLPQLEEEELLRDIQEESINDHSTYIPSAGELSSTVVIPHQARENYDSGTPELSQKNLMTSSEHNLTDHRLYEQPPTEKRVGSHNPLAIIGDIEGESAISEKSRTTKRFPPLEAIDPQDLITGKIYNNPVYDMEKKRQEKEAVKLSRSTPLSMLRASQKVQVRATYSSIAKHDCAARKLPEANRLAPTKKPLEITQSSPITSFRDRKKDKLRASHTLPPTPNPEGEVEAVVTLIDEIDNLDVVIDTGHSASTDSVLSRQTRNTTGASARTYNEMKHNSNTKLPTRPISSSHSFIDNPASTLSDIQTVESIQTSATHDPAIRLPPRYQLSLSKTITPCLETPTNTAHSHLPTATNISNQAPPEAPKDVHVILPSIAITSSSTKTDKAIPFASSKENPPQTTQLVTSSKGSSVMELRQRFESLSSTPPTSPSSLTSPSPALYSSFPLTATCTQTHCTDADLDSGREV